MNKVVWFYNRLKAMSFNEVMFRMKKYSDMKSYKRISKKKLNIDEVFEEKIDINKVFENLDNMFFKIEEIDIDDNLVFKIFNEEINIFDRIDWHKGMVKSWDKDTFSKSIDFKNRDDIGDVRCSWEINRHLFFPYLALLYKRNKESKYIYLIEELFESWKNENKFLNGINWSSSMEISIRAYSWLITVFILKDISITHNLCESLLRGIIVSNKYVVKNFSLFSSANNHLILEAAISSLIGMAFRDVFNEDWFTRGYKILNNEIYIQFHKDGINKEQALHYQGFVTDIMLQYNSVMKRLGERPIHEDLIKKSVEFIGNIKANSLNVDFGDSDDAKILLVSNKKYNYYDYLLSFASAYYNEKFIDNITWYNEIMLFIKKRFVSNKHNYDNITIYEDGGYAVINSRKTSLIFDFGELGFGSLAAHGHADALMFLYSYGNKSFFVDSGTYIYNIESEKRNFYRSTEAHNTLSYNDTDQSIILGPFLWGRKAEVKLLNKNISKDKVILEAEHYGYSPNIHKRKIEYIFEKDLLIINDSFSEEAKLNFILDNLVLVEKVAEHIFKLINKDEKIYIYCDGILSLEKTNISKCFTKEIETNKISVFYDFKSTHRTIICCNLEYIENILKGEF